MLPVKRSRAKCRHVCWEVENTVIADGSSPSLFSKPGLQRAHPNGPLIHRLQCMASAARHTGSALAAHRRCPLLHLQRAAVAGLAGALGGLMLLTASLWLLPGSQLLGQKSLFCHRKQKLLYLSQTSFSVCPRSLFRGAKPKQVRIWLCYYFGLS